MGLKTIPMADGLKARKLDLGIRLIDVRTPSEYFVGHIPGAINIPSQQLDMINTIIPNKQTKIFVYCQHGHRARQSGEYLLSIGYKDVTSLGGIEDYSGPLEYQ